MTIEAELLGELKENLAAAERALKAHEWVALRALASHEDRIMDGLRTIWRSRR